MKLRLFTEELVNIKYAVYYEQCNLCYINIVCTYCNLCGGTEEK